MEILLIEDTITQTTPLWKVMLDGELIGRVSQETDRHKAWRVLPESSLPRPTRKMMVLRYRSREAAACAVAVYYYEGEREARR